MKITPKKDIERFFGYFSKRKFDHQDPRQERYESILGRVLDADNPDEKAQIVAIINFNLRGGYITNEQYKDLLEQIKA